ncbi:MAG: GNAT family N-acetyltransferase [Fibrobacter sp.]|nr:GNAT family N-acetyltransferase [Fibrobacter sp.]
MARELVIHGIYRHFKNLYYRVETVAKHSETEEDYVVYRKMYGDRGCWVREKQMFLSEVDREKYPDAPQQYRFEYLKLQSDRIYLRPWDDSDASRLLELSDHTETANFAGIKLPESEEECLNLIQTTFKNEKTWAIALKENGDVIGAVGLLQSRGASSMNAEPQISCWVGKMFRNQGFRTEAMKLVLY